MKRYYFSWYNYVAQSQVTDFIIAENITEAKQIAVLIMQFYGGSRYSVEDIDHIDELEDKYFYKMETIKDMYDKTNKKFKLPEIKIDEDDEDGEEDL